MDSNDLHVARVSDCLAGRTIDLVISGSIGAVESVRFIRALRRLGAEVQAWLTPGGAQFTTETALAWATTRPVRTRFEGSASHIAQHDACVIAPSSANMMSKIAHGQTDTPASALVASYLGQGKPIILIPNMHDSLLASPFIAANLRELSKFCTILEARQEEGKQKFPEPKFLADQVAHRLNQGHGKDFLLTMGSTRGPIDAVRYISNYSSGALGTSIATEFYRNGHKVHIVAGPCHIRPAHYTELKEITTNEEMLDAVQEIVRTGVDGAIFAASVLDFTPAQELKGKVKSSGNLEVQFVRTAKIIDQVTQPLTFKVGFKLEVDKDPLQKQATISEYLKKYRLSHLVYNQLQAVSSTTHTAEIFSAPDEPGLLFKNKSAIAKHLVFEAEKIL